MNYLEIRETLLCLAEEKHRLFNQRIIPKQANILGVRVPAIRTLAKELLKNNWQEFLVSPHIYFEEYMLHGIIIGCLKLPLEKTLELITAFVPMIDNWSVCDTFCASLKITKQYKKELWRFILPYFKKEDVYQLRFGIVMSLWYFIEEEKLSLLFSLYNDISHSDYYVKMAIAWAVASCFTVYPKETMLFLNETDLDDITYNMTLQKILDSLQVTKKNKSIVRKMKRRPA